MTDKFMLPLFVSGTILLVLFVFFIITYLLVQKQKQNAYQLEKSRMIYNHQNKLLQVRIDEQERAMDQVSEEIHDNIGQLLFLAKINVHRFAGYTNDEEGKELVENTKKLIVQLINSVSSISHGLNTDYIKTKGLLNALEEETKFISDANNINCTVEHTGDHKIFEPEKELFIYRIAQEALHNIIKHAHATEVNIKLVFEPGNFFMAIKDNGRGFARNEIYELKGIGLLNMMQRAKLLDGTLDIASEPSKGCTITLKI